MGNALKCVATICEPKKKWNELIVTVQGDLSKAPDTYIVHQANCCYKKPAQGAAASVYKQFPEADPYFPRAEALKGVGLGRPIDKPGTIFMAGRVVNLFGQFAPGKPVGSREAIDASNYKEDFASLPDILDSAEERLQWFKQSLRVLYADVKNTSEARAGTMRFAMPTLIGCGLAGGTWDGEDGFWKAIRVFAEEYQVKISMYEFQGVAGETSGLTGQVVYSCEQHTNNLATGFYK